MNDLSDNRLVKLFAELKAASKKTLLPFLSAGYPDLETTGLLLDELQARGVRACELGFPFSDPVADGPVIQNSYAAALEQGATCDGILDVVRNYRSGGGSMALAAMVSYSIIYRHGVNEFLETCKSAGFDAMIIPDLPMEESQAVGPAADRLGLCNVLLVAPTTSPERRIEIARRSRGFIYYVSVAGITGQRDSLPEETIRGVEELRKHVQTPVCVGFGISDPQTVATVCQVADGAIVGSAIVKRLMDAKARGATSREMAACAGAFVEELITPLR
ncbi:MAG: tryptophan synthase subunit alpha [Planctomycetes bacterium]|nr:tryptophan synthase subunit alpha [Planctomycetota bacterium]